MVFSWMIPPPKLFSKSDRASRACLLAATVEMRAAIFILFFGVVVRI